jgi:hypothetical protein
VSRVARLLHDCARGEPTLVEGAGNLCSVLTQQQLAAMTGSVRALERDRLSHQREIGSSGPRSC